MRRTRTPVVVRPNGSTAARLGALALLLVVSLSACGGSSDGSDSTTRVESLWSSRTSYVGDNSRVLSLVRAVGPAPVGSYRISLRTAHPPYALTISLNRLDKPFNRTDFSGQATLLLGLINNLDRVSVTSRAGSYSMTTASASTRLGYDVKELGRNRARLVAYVKADRD